MGAILYRPLSPGRPSSLIESLHGVVQLQREGRRGVSVRDDFDINAGLGFGGLRHCHVQFRAGRHSRRQPIVATESVREIGIMPGRDVIVGDGGIFAQPSLLSTKMIGFRPSRGNWLISCTVS